MRRMGAASRLLKILLTNQLHFRLPLLHQPQELERGAARASRAQEVVDLTLDFYRRNYIEGLFLSSGIMKNRPTTRWSSWSRSRAACARITTFAVTSI
jgi:predicted DNA-binding helix-hairpin-helix protein